MLKKMFEIQIYSVVKNLEKELENDWLAGKI